MKHYPLGEVKDHLIGEPRTPRRNTYEFELKMEVIGSLIKGVRNERKLTQAELGALIGVQKAQISKLENNIQNVSIGTLLKVFDALNAKVLFRIELIDNELKIL